MYVCVDICMELLVKYIKRLLEFVFVVKLSVQPSMFVCVQVNNHCVRLEGGRGRGVVRLYELIQLIYKQKQ